MTYVANDSCSVLRKKTTDALRGMDKSDILMIDNTDADACGLVTDGSLRTIYEARHKEEKTDWIRRVIESDAL